MVATLRVENVVYDPRNPTDKNNLGPSGQILFADVMPNNRPKTKEPDIFTINVPAKEEFK
tara:strand:- start:392 stop:571 length:180 start_codon:yes stop_codon:yes gene_type:complete